MPAKKPLKKAVSKKTTVRSTSPFSLVDNKYLVFMLMVCALIPLAMIMQVFFSNFKSIAHSTMPEVFVGEEATSSARVFITSTTYNGNLGGLDGADAKCQERADVANLGGSWKAWLSDSNNSVSSRLIHSETPYKRIDGVIIANNWDDLIDGSIQNTLDINESGVKNSYLGVWTNTQIDGNKITADNTKSCNNWTAGYWGPSAVQGIAYHTDGTWTHGMNYTTCQNIATLYCIEQIENPSPTPTPTISPSPTPTATPFICPFLLSSILTMSSAFIPLTVF